MAFAEGRRVIENLSARDEAIRAAGEKLAAAGVSKWNRVLVIAEALELVATTRNERPRRLIADDIERAFAANSFALLARTQIARILDGRRDG
jgi:hypothetical protein